MATNAATSMDEMAPSDDKGPLVQFARFQDGRFQLFKGHTKETSYIAVSHVWGDVAWRYVPIIGREAKISEQKARFVCEELPELVGDTPFWMDTLTVNQRDQRDVIATVQAVPSIFRDAQKTLAVRECDGFYACCGDVVSRRGRVDIEYLEPHIAETHPNCLMEESYLQRLWTLQECLLSRTIQFVSTSKGQDLRPDTQIQTRSSLDVEVGLIKMLSALYTIVKSLNLHNKDIPEFGVAYVTGGTLRRDVVELPRDGESLFSTKFGLENVNSTRVATMARDYVFATMPQFPWYRYPEDAESMDFCQIFADLQEQARVHGVHQGYRFLRGMVEWHSNEDPSTAWLPAKDIPEPKSLGDFLKLFRSVSSFELNGRLKPGISFFPVTIHTLDDDFFKDTKQLLRTISNTFDTSANVWFSAILGELGQQGFFPESKSGESSTQTIAGQSTGADDSDRTKSLQDIVSANGWDDRVLFEQAGRALSSFARELSDRSDGLAPLTVPWYLDIETGSTRHVIFLRTIALLAAMVNSLFPLSSAAWTRDRFTPVKIRSNNITVLALLPLHAVPEEGITTLKAFPTVQVGGLNFSDIDWQDIIITDVSGEVPLSSFMCVREFITGEDLPEEVKEQLVIH